jgi:phytoene dehydrogenase-like protein
MNITIIGGGLSGLAAAAFLSRGGAKVTLYEKSQLGGRARTTSSHGALFNEGPHALSRGGLGIEVLRALGIVPEGGVPPYSGSLAWHAGRLHALPVGPVSLLSTSLLSAAEKLELAPLLARLDRIDTAPLDGLELGPWIDSVVRSPACRALVRANFRVSTYANDDGLSAGAAVRQLQRGVRDNVLYIHGGWQTLVDALRQRAVSAGAHFVEHRRIDSLEGLNADAVVLAVSPSAAATLTSRPLAEGLRPARAACLDLALDALPKPRRGFALGIDAPLYFSVHTRVADLAAPGIHAVHAAKYLSPSDAGAGALAELEALVDAMQPGWREHVVARRFLPEMIVSNAVPTPKGRPNVDAAGPGIFLAGDWVGPEGMLADVALSSGREAARRILALTARAAA